MFKIITKTGLAVLIAAGTLTGAAGVASAAEGFRVTIGTEIAQEDYYSRRPDRRRGCSPRLAEDIARDYGMRRTQVVDVTPRRVVVEGRVRGGWDRMVFANVRGCPLLRR